MSRRNIGIIVIVVGLAIIAVALLAGYIGLSASTAIGTRKLLAAGAGVIVSLVGLFLAASKQ